MKRRRNEVASAVGWGEYREADKWFSLYWMPLAREALG
jgi:hypothetical protein